MFGDITNHPRFAGIQGACTYLAKKKIGRLSYWGDSWYEFRLGKRIRILFLGD